MFFSTERERTKLETSAVPNTRLGAYVPNDFERIVRPLGRVYNEGTGRGRGRGRFERRIETKDARNVSNSRYELFIGQILASGFIARIRSSATRVSTVSEWRLSEP